MKKITIEPAEQRVVILPDENPEKIGNIIIPGGLQTDKPRFGTIVSVGIGSIDHPMKYLVGNRVLFSQYSGVEVELNLIGEVKTYLVMNQMDIMMKIWEVD